jgi:hypothetical protein
MQSTNTNIAPIFDDFSEDKNFHRILFNAGKSVQARELTQSQSILQNQIERIGRHLFNEGSMVVPGGVHAIESQDCIKITLPTWFVYTDFSAEPELYIKSNNTGLIAKVAHTFDADSVTGDPISLFYDVLTPGLVQEKTIALSDAITIFRYDSTGQIFSLATATVTGINKGAWVKVQSGVYFIRGMFVKTTNQEYIISKYTTDRTVKIGFGVTEEIITSDTDISLFSNALGYPNANASGASRLKVTLNLIGIDVNAINKDFIEIARFDGGALASVIDYTSYSIIEKAIAKRTYETSGDYVINEFGVDIKEHLKTDTNGGVYALANGGDSTKLVASLKPGVGYVQGYRVENIGIQNTPFDKARDTAFLNNASYTADYGQYFLVTNMKSLPDMDIKKRLLMLNSSQVQIGTAAVRAIRKDGANYRVYVFDLAFSANSFVSNVSSIKYTDSSSLFTADLVGSVLYNTSSTSLVFKLPISAVKSLFQSGIGGDTSYTVLRAFNLTANSAGVVSASVGTNEFFASVDTTSYFIGLTGSASIGTLFDPVTSISLGGAILGTTMTINLGSGNANVSIKVIAPVIKSQTTQKTKTLLTITDEVINFPDTNRQQMANADIYDIVSVKDAATNEDLTSMFTFDNGQKDSWYENGKLIVIDSSLIIRNIKVTYRHFGHSAGDYFTVDSYSGLARESIPYFNGNNLSDYIDFRPLKNSLGTFTSATVFGEIIKPGDSIRADITYYLPRSDIVCVSSAGDFSVVRGIPSLTPAVPSTPYASMKLYEVSIPPYTMKTSDIIIKSIDNKRYTMRDIGKLENRIANIEYYTTLSALESATNKTEVIDPVTGNNRFKNGFAVDGFNSFGMSDLASPEWSASMDLTANLLNPSFGENGVGFTSSTLTNTVKPSKVYMKAYTETPVVTQPYATMTININPYAVFAWVGAVALTPDRDYWKDVKYIEPIIINNTINLRVGAVEGLAWGSWAQTRSDNMLGGHEDWRRSQRISYQTNTIFRDQTFSASTESTLSTNIIPFMRSIPISFSCTGFRPFTRLYPFFDAVDISADCNPTGGIYGDSIVTDSHGAVTGTFLVPNTASKSFATGESVMRFSDSATNSLDPIVITTQGSTTFSSGGLLDIKQVTTTNTLVLTATTANTGAVQYLDPIAQTFIAPSTGGCFITKVDIFFASKARDIPVTLQVRTAFGGFPTSDVLGYVTINPAQVSVSNDATAATSFIFNDPIFLTEGLEYAVVLVADTQEYNVYIAEQGQNVIGQQMALSKQAYMGSFLTSSNGSTWNAQQNRDMKFTLHRAIFGLNDSSAIFDNVAPIALPLTFNSVSTVSGSGLVKIKLKSHGLKAGDNTTVAGCLVAGNGILPSDVNGTKVVLVSDIDTFTYQASTNANATGTIGGNGMTAVVNYPFNIFVNNLDAFTPDGCGVYWNIDILHKQLELNQLGYQ